MDKLFEVDYLKKATELFQETFYFKKYKAMKAPIAIIMAIMLFPIQLLSIAVAVPLFISAFVLKFVLSVIRSTHSVLTTEGQKLKHASQLIIYFFSWPIVFVSYIAAAFFYILVVINYALYACTAYVWTLGGFKFNAYIADADDVSIDVKGKYSLKLQLVYTLIIASLIVLIPSLLSMLATVGGGIITAIIMIIPASSSINAMLNDSTITNEEFEAISKLLLGDVAIALIVALALGLLTVVIAFLINLNVGHIFSGCYSFFAMSKKPVEIEKAEEEKDTAAKEIEDLKIKVK